MNLQFSFIPSDYRNAPTVTRFFRPLEESREANLKTHKNKQNGRSLLPHVFLRQKRHKTNFPPKEFILSEATVLFVHVDSQEIEKG